MKSFFDPDAETRVRDAIVDVERRSSAEVVVALRRTSGHYRHADYLAGLVSALAALSVFLYHPEPFDFTFLPGELLGFFAVGALVSANFPPLRRLLTARGLREENVHRAARAFFVDRGVACTRGRTGILVYLSMFEQRIEVVADIGVDDAALGAVWEEARAKLTGASSLRGLDAFIEALRGLGPALAEGLPRAADDVNELPDEVST